MRDFIADVAFRVRTLFRRADAEREMTDELQFHLDLEVERLMGDGLSPSEARRSARIAFGHVEQVKEAARDAWGTRAVEAVLRDLRQALRLARRQPVFSTVVTLSLALGLAATLTVVNVAYNILFAPLALPRPDELVMPLRWNEDGRDWMFTWHEAEALRAVSGVALAALRGASAVGVRAGDRWTFVNMDFVEGTYFDILGTQPLRGRLISPDDDREREPVVVVSREFAEQIFPGDSDVVGRAVEIRGVTFTVIGVTKDSFGGVRWPARFTAAIPMGAVTLLGANGIGTDNRGIPYGRDDDRLGSRAVFQLVGRRSVDFDVAQASLAAAFARCCGLGPTGQHEWLQVVDISHGIPGGKGDNRRELRGTLAIVVAGVALLLVVVCCNVASLLVVRSATRQREIAVRLSLGASRGRIIRQLVLETVPLAAAGGLVGLFLAAWFAAGVTRSLPSDWSDVAPMFVFTVRPLVIVTAASLTAACVFACAAYPALHATNRLPLPSLRMDNRASPGRAQGAAARGVVVAQVAVTVVLVTCAALLSATLVNLSRTDPGLDADGMLLAGLGTRSTSYEATGIIPLADNVTRAVERVPGVRAVTMATLLPLFGGSNYAARVDVPGVVPKPGFETYARLVVVRGGYFTTSGLHIVAGFEFDASGTSGAGAVGVVNEAFVHTYLRDRNPIGQQIRVAMSDDPDLLTFVQIVGVCADASYDSMRDPPQPYVYVPLAGTTAHWRDIQLVVRTTSSLTTVGPAVREAIERTAPGIEVRRMRDARTQVLYSTALERLTAQLAVFTSGMTLVLAAIGLYGVVAHGVSQRTMEIGIRIALGARSSGILWLVSRETFRLVGAGIMVGTILAFGATRAMRSQFFGVSAHDPIVLVGAALSLALVAAAASILPARHATRIDPRTTLNSD